VETGLPWHAWNVGRLADGRWAAHSFGWSCTDADGNYLLVDPGGSGDCGAPGVGEIVDPVGTVYTSEDGRSWSVAATVPGVTSALWIGGDLLVGVWVSEFEAEWSVFDGDRLVRSEFFDSIEGSGSSDGASFPLAGTLVWAEYLDGALAVAADMDRVFVANVWQMNLPESWGVFVETSDRWAEYGPEGEPWAGMASDRSLWLFRENPRASVFMYDGFWHVLRLGDGTVWRSGDRRTWDLLGEAAGLPFVGFESQLAPAVHSGQIVEFGDRLVFTAYIDTNGGVKGYFATSTDAVNWTPLEVPDVFGAPPAVWRSQVIDGWLVVALDAVGSTARVIASPDLENWYQFPAPWSGGSGFASGLGEGVVISRASSGPGELPRTWLAVPPGS
jgi:hypothetical protein